MRISHVVPYRLDPYSGVYTAIANVTASLARRGHDVEVWELSPWPAEALELAELVDGSGAVRRTVPASSRPWALTAEAKRVFTRELKAEVVHLHSAFSPQNNLVARRVTAPLVLSPHGVFAAESLAQSRLKKQVFRRLFEMPALRRVGALCALTEEEQREAREFGYEGRIEVIPNGVAAPPPGLPTDALRDELGIAAEDRVALFVGRVDLHHKRIDEAAQQVARTPGWHLVVVGPDHRGDAQRLRELVSTLDGRERIHLLGARRGPSLAMTFAGADLFILVSRHEGMPMALLEALSHGLPAIVSPEVEATLPVGRRGAGWVAAVPRLSALLDTLRDPAERTTASAGALRMAEDYRWSAIAERYERLYADLAGVR